MLAVSDTSPILNLAIVDQLPLLHQQFNEILIPNAVLNELKINEERPGSKAIREAISAGWIRPCEVSNQLGVEFLKQTLDSGEAEAIVLSVDLRPDWILLDEREGRKIAKGFGLKVTGVLGVLIRAKQTGSLESLRSVIEDLMSKAGFWIAPELLEQILKQ